MPSALLDIPVIVVGGQGRLGSAVTAECRHRGIVAQGKQAAEPWPPALPRTVVLDAGGPDGLPATVAYCRRNAVGLVYAVSGLDDAGRTALQRLAGDVPVVLATNLSLGHWLQARIGRWLARTVSELGETVEASVWERHTRAKQHRPSSSAVELARDWAAGAGRPVPEIVSLRSGHPVSEHALQLDWAHESLTVHHDVRDLRAAAAGAMLALAHVAGAGPGLTRFDAVLDQMLLAA
ncbi:MAG: dihydrodipicolinate reductase C-terminal domain-containing protein [Jatrophihabitantaceae bacterium]